MATHRDPFNSNVRATAVAPEPEVAVLYTKSPVAEGTDWEAEVVA